MLFKNLTENFSSIEEESNMPYTSGRILIDQLFITGGENNRFICCDFQNGKLDLKTARIVFTGDLSCKETVEWLHNNYNYVEHLILIENQR